MNVAVLQFHANWVARSVTAGKGFATPLLASIVLCHVLGGPCATEGIFVGCPLLLYKLLAEICGICDGNKIHRPAFFFYLDHLSF